MATHIVKILESSFINHDVKRFITENRKAIILFPARERMFP